MNLSPMKAAAMAAQKWNYTKGGRVLVDETGRIVARVHTSVISGESEAVVIGKGSLGMYYTEADAMRAVEKVFRALVDQAVKP